MTSICKRLQIPHFIANWQPIDADHFNGTDSYTRNLFPNLNSYSIALYEIIKSFRWQTFAAIYDNNDSLLKLKHSFSMTINSNDMIKPKITFYKVPKDPNDYKLLLKSISKTGINQVLIDCSLDITLSLLRQSSKVNMMNEYVVCWILLDLLFKCWLTEAVLICFRTIYLSEPMLIPLTYRKLPI